MVVSREFFKRSQTIRRDVIYGGASVPSDLRHDYFQRLVAPDAFNDHTFAYTSKKPWIMINIHCGIADKQDPHMDGVTVNGSPVEFVRGGNRYYEYPAIVTAFTQVTPNQENIIQIKIGGGTAPSMGNGAIHIREITDIGTKINHSASTGSSMGWSVGVPDVNGVQKGWLDGDIIIASAYSENPLAHPVYGRVTNQFNTGIYTDFPTDGLGEFAIGEGAYSAGSVTIKLTQAMLDAKLVDPYVRASQSGQSTIAFAFLRGATI